MARTRKQNRRSQPGSRCPACTMGVLTDDGEGLFCATCLYTPGPRITLEDAVARAEAVALAESRALREGNDRERRRPHGRRAA